MIKSDFVSTLLFWPKGSKILRQLVPSMLLAGLKISPDIHPSNFQALVLPGGFHSHGFDEIYDPRIHERARNIHQNNGFIANMCVGIFPIADTGLLEGKKATTYPYSKHHDNFSRLKAKGSIAQDKNVVIDNRIISCKGPNSSLEVLFLLMECLMGNSVAAEVKKNMVYE